MTQVTDWDHNVTTYEYDDADQLITTHLPNGVTSSYTYDESGQLLLLKHESETTLLSSFEYTYDAVGNRTQAIEFLLLPGEEPEPPYKIYLPIISNQTAEGGLQSSTYNTEESTTFESPSISHTITYTYDPLYRLTQADYASGEFFHYTYDSVGNRLTQDTHNGTNLYAYDVANRLIEVAGVPKA